MASMLDSFKTGKVPKSSDLMCKIEAFDADLGRTGTMSFSAALEKLLEGPIYHSGNMLISDDECMVFLFIKQAVTRRRGGIAGLEFQLMQSLHSSWKF